MLTVRSLFSRRSTWSFAIYAADDDKLLPSTAPVATFGSRKLLRGPCHIHTRSDPCLFVRDNRLYVFYETQCGDQPGRISAAVTSDLMRWRSLGDVLIEPTHLSYPNVFAIGDWVYMIPESKQAGEVRLYRFTDFPHGVELVRVLIDRPLNDPSPVFIDGIWYLFATSDRGLELYVADDILSGNFVRHPVGVISTDIANRRCGGTLFRHGGRLYRPAQDCGPKYGDNLSLFEVTALSPTDYAETLAFPRILRPTAAWNSDGGHHLSRVRFRGRYVYVIDGQSKDYYIHKFTGRVANLVLPSIETART